ncbi:hypothetical protein COLO4_09988 [Corchorus olitorius]|uniref:Uncharacterized protein n=1 Tax=Corchorus olitorius TaxID=93759 RepID=A0A1R3KAC1_9ROSI|nr:hypothetical protein COLO4_09988 [Corchorus olitorius]
MASPKLKFVIFAMFMAVTFSSTEVSRAARLLQQSTDQICSMLLQGNHQDDDIDYGGGDYEEEMEEYWKKMKDDCLNNTYNYDNDDDLEEQHDLIGDTISKSNEEEGMYVIVISRGQVYRFHSDTDTCESLNKGTVLEGLLSSLPTNNETATSSIVTDILSPLLN